MLAIQIQTALKDLGAVRGRQGSKGAGTRAIAEALGMSVVNGGGFIWEVLDALEVLEDANLVWSTAGADGRLVFYLVPIPVSGSVR